MKLTQSQIDRIADLTDRNFHTNARLLMISCLNQDGKMNTCNRMQLEAGYKFIEEQHSFLNWLPDHLAVMRRSLDELLKQCVYKMAENADKIWGAL